MILSLLKLQSIYHQRASNALLYLLNVLLSLCAGRAAQESALERAARILAPNSRHPEVSHLSRTCGILYCVLVQTGAEIFRELINKTTLHVLPQNATH